MMDIRILIFTILAAATCSSCHLPTRYAPNVPDPSFENIRGNHSVTGFGCVAAAHRNTHSSFGTRMKRSRTGRVSLSSGSAPSPYITPDNSTKTNSTKTDGTKTNNTKKNGTETNTTIPAQQTFPKIPSWIPTLENVITPIFRTILLLLTLFNIDMTWRIHGQWAVPRFMRSWLSSKLTASTALHVGRRPLRHRIQPAGRGWPV